MLPQWTIVGFAGHREISEPQFISIQIKAVLNRLEQLGNPLAVISSAASGADLIFLEAITQRNFPLWLILPFEKSRFEKDHSPENLERFRKILETALQLEEIASAATDDEAYMESGERIVEQADVLVAVWDGKPAAGLGGTADVVALARKQEKPLVWINSVNGQINEERLYHLPHRNSGMVAQAPSKEVVEAHFQQLDDLARTSAPTARYLVQQIILLHLFASAVGLVVPVFELSSKAGLAWLEYAFAGIELAVLFAAFIMAAAQHRRHKEWICSRIEAEICRSFLGTWQVRRKTGLSFKLSVPGFEALCKNLRLLQSMDKTPPSPLSDARENYITQRLQEQIGYFQTQADLAHRAHSRLKSIALGCTSIAGMLVLLTMVLSWREVHGLPEQLVRLLTLVLPLGGAALYSLILTMEYSRRATRYQEMKKFLEDKTNRLKLVQTWNGLIRIATETEEQLIREIVEWHAYSRFVATTH